MLNIDLSKIIYGNSDMIQINEEFCIEKDLLKNTDIKDISKIHVNGCILKENENYKLSITVKGSMVLTCARTLKDVDYPFSIDIEEIIDKNNDNSIQIVKNSLDIFPIIWQYILVDVPLRVLAPDAKEMPIEGNGWRLITEDNKKEEIDPRLAKLKDYL